MLNIEHIIKDMNRHMPSSRRTLLEHLESGDRTYRTKDGHVCTFDQEELDRLSGICTEIEKMRLRLPIFISTDTLAESAWKADGIIETAVISKILGIKPMKDDMIRFYHPHLISLRKQFPNAVTVLYLP